MVSTASTLWYVDAEDPAAVLRAHRDPDPAAAQALAEQLFGEFEIVPKMIGTLAGCAGPDPDEVYIGRYPGLTVVCTRAARLPDPADLPELLVRPLASDHTYLVSFDTGMGWGAFAHWERGEFRRGFSSSRMKILADAGLPYVWERPFWAGERPVLWRADELPDPQCLPFDPPDFADEASRRWLGFQYRAPVVAGALLPRDIAVCGFTLVPKSPPPETPAPEPDPGGAHGRGHGVNKSGTHGRSHGRRRGPRALEVGRPAQPADAAAPPQAWPQDATSEAPDSAGEPASAERKRATDTDVDPGAEGSSRRAHPHHQAADTRSATGPGAAEPTGGPHTTASEPPESTNTGSQPGPRGKALDPRATSAHQSGPDDRGSGAHEQQATSTGAQVSGARGQIPASRRPAREALVPSADADATVSADAARPVDEPLIGPPRRGYGQRSRSAAPQSGAATAVRASEQQPPVATTPREAATAPREAVAAPREAATPREAVTPREAAAPRDIVTAPPEVVAAPRKVAATAPEKERRGFLGWFRDATRAT